MAQAKTGDTVRVHYTGKLEDGTVFDTSVNREPLQFTIGQGQIIPGFEEAVVGMNPGQSKTAKVPMEKAYGTRSEEKIIVVQKDQFPAHIKPKVGQQLQMSQPDNQTAIVTVTKISESQVTLDTNHPLAGKDLTFEIHLVEIV